MSRSRQPRPGASEELEAGFPWLWALLGISFLTLVLQLVPSAWWSVPAILDVRLWTWRAYASVCTVAIVVLVAARAWLENSRQNR